MKKVLMFLVDVVFVLVGTANAALTNYGDGMLYDNANKQYWDDFL